MISGSLEIHETLFQDVNTQYGDKANGDQNKVEMKNYTYINTVESI